MSAPTDIEIAVDRWRTASEIDDIIGGLEDECAVLLCQLEACEARGVLATKLGVALGRLDFLIAELRSTEVRS